MWKDIAEFEERYEISDDGVVRNKKTKRILSLKLDKYGYYQIGLRKKESRKKYWFSVHRLVALHFIGDPPVITYQIDHKDQNKLNNSVSNLRWVSSLDNNLNRQMKAWSSNSTTGELYITKYNNGYMIRINRANYKRRIWEKDLETAIKRRDVCLQEILDLN